MARLPRIGSGAGFAGDRLEPTVCLAEHGEIGFLALEYLGERTVALPSCASVTILRAATTCGWNGRPEESLPMLNKNAVRLIRSR